MINKKGELAFDQIIMIAVALTALIVIILIFLPKIAQNGKFINSCEAIHGVLRPSCDSSVSQTASGKDKKTQTYCCVKKFGTSSSAYESWVNKTKDKEPSSSGSSGSSSQTVATVGDDTIDLKALGNEVAGITLNGKRFLNGDDALELTQGQKFSIAATHNLKDGNYCQLYITKAVLSNGQVKADTSSGSVRSLPGFSTSSSTCKPTQNGLVGLHLKGSITQEGLYKADFIVRKSSGSDVLTSRTLVFIVEQDNSILDEIQTKGTSFNSLNIELSFLVDRFNRQSTIFCSVQAKSNYNFLGSTHVEFAREGCESATVFSTLQTGFPLIPSDAVCLHIVQTYTDTDSSAQEQDYEQTFLKEQCDSIELQNTVHKIQTCSTTCENLDADMCTNYLNRPDGCQYTLNCYKPWIGSCKTCKDDMIDCSDYKTQKACEANECTLKRCEWVDSVIGGQCIPQQS